MSIRAEGGDMPVLHSRGDLRLEAGGSMKHRVFGILSIAILILGILSLTNKFSEASETTIEKILSSKESFDGKEVSVSDT
jgi:hypothetical protein